MNWKETWEKIQVKMKIMSFYFADQKDMILTYNLQIYEKLSVFCIAIFFLYTLTTGLLLKEWRVTTFHGVFLVILAVHIGVAHYVNRHRWQSKVLEKALCVLFSLCVYLLLICVDTVAMPDKSQSFCAAFLVVAPCIFIMNFSRMLIDQLFFVIVYGLFAFNFKDTAVATHDMYAIWAGFFFGIILYSITMDLRLQVNSEVIRLKHFSETDELTKINNRREANSQITYLLDHREADCLCALMMVDIDAFKGINDTYGHKAGDDVLVAVADVLANSFRKTDVVARYGGDEFMVFIHAFGKEEFLHKKVQGYPKQNPCHQNRRDSCVLQYRCLYAVKRALHNGRACLRGGQGTLQNKGTRKGNLHGFGSS